MTRSGIAYTPEKTQGYENLVKMCYMEQGNRVKLEGRVQVAILAFFQIPKSAGIKKYADMHRGAIRPTKKPDTDNIMKIILDSLNKLAYDDDSQVVSARIEKFYSDEPRVEVAISNF